MMMSANMDVPAWTAIELMKKTCSDVGEEGPDHVFGAGLLQAQAAVRAVKELKD